MKRILIFLVIIGLALLLISIPNKQDRTLAITVYASMTIVLFGTYLIRRAYEHRLHILFYLLLPFYAVKYLFTTIREKVRRYEESIRLTPEEEYEVHKNSFDEPLGIGA